MRYLSEEIITQVASGTIISPIIKSDFMTDTSLHVWPIGNVGMTVTLEISNEPTNPVNWYDLSTLTINTGTPGLIPDTLTTHNWMRILCDGGFGENGTVTTRADSSGNLNDTYFTVYDPTLTTTYLYWFNVNSAGTDPAIPGTVSIEVDLATNATAPTVAAAIVAASFLVPMDLNVTNASAVITFLETIAAPGLLITEGAVPTGFTFGTINATGTINVAIKTNGF